MTVADMGNYYNLNGSAPEPNWQAQTKSSDDTVHQRSVYSAARFSLADPLALVVGARYTEWSTGGMTSSFSKDKV